MSKGRRECAGREGRMKRYRQTDRKERVRMSVTTVRSNLPIADFDEWYMS